MEREEYNGILFVDASVSRRYLEIIISLDQSPINTG